MRATVQGASALAAWVASAFGRGLRAGCGQRPPLCRAGPAEPAGGRRLRASVSAERDAVRGCREMQVSSSNAAADQVARMGEGGVR